jgi:hypothetical protein
MHKNEKGFSVVEVLFVVVIAGLIAVVGWFVLDKHKSKSTVNNSTKVTSQKATSNEVKTADTTKPNPNTDYLVLKEWDLRFKTPSGLTDVRYIIHGDTVAFYAKPANSSVQYRSNYNKYEDGSSPYATGVLYRSTDSSTTVIGNETRQGKKLGNYYYYTAWSFSSLATGAACVGLYGDSASSCEPEGIAFNLVNQGDSALLNTIELAQ